LIGLPVIDIVTGKRTGTVRDVLVDRSWKLRGVILYYKSWFSSARYVEWKSVCSAGHDSIMIDSRKSIKKYKDTPGVYYLSYGKNCLKGLPLVSVEGIQMGLLEDVYFSQKMEDSIIGFELSEGLLTDLQEGRRTIPVPDGAERGVDVILVPVQSYGESRESEWTS
jgi:uncharacterized protein YrrD